MKQRFSFTAVVAPQRTATPLSSVAAMPVLTDVAATEELRVIGPAMAPRDEAVYLLHSAAEIEHALMVQYLFAGYSLNPDSPGADAAAVRRWKATLLGIAKEEMGHLLTVQNVLRLLGGPPNLEREDFPFRSDLYPFHFQLQGLSKISLARYLAAEMPFIERPDDEIQSIVALARRGNENISVNRVGSLFARLIDLIGNHLEETDFLSDISGYQAGPEDWSGSAKPPTRFDTLIITTNSRADALKALTSIAQQGEGTDQPADGTLSHFDRFLTLYREFTAPRTWSAVHAVAPNPTAESITHAEARRWADLFNLRYRLLLGFLAHYLQLPGPAFDAAGHRTPRGFLVIWTFYEMRNLQKIAETLVRLPFDDPPGGLRAGPAFEIPYALNIPDRESDRWRSHLSVIASALRLSKEFSVADPFLAQMVASTEETADAIRSLAKGSPVARKTGYPRVAEVLEEAVRGFDFDCSAHAKFWRDPQSGEVVPESEFVNATVFGPILMPGNGKESGIIQALRHQGFQMPAGRPAVPAKRINEIERYIDALKPDAADHKPATAGVRFQTVKSILDDAVNGQSFGAHGPFWRSQSRDQFVAHKVFGRPLLQVGDSYASNLVKALRGEPPFGQDQGVPVAVFRRMPAGRPPMMQDQIAFIAKWIDDGCPDDVLSPQNGTVDANAGGPADGSVHLAYWREFDNWALFEASPEIQAAVGAYFNAAPSWLAFATDPAAEPAWNSAIVQPEVQQAIQLLAARQMATVHKHYGTPVALLTLLDSYERFGDDSLPDDPTRPQRPRHSMDGVMMWFFWGAFADACLRLNIEPTFWRGNLCGILIGLMNDGLFRGRFTIIGFEATQDGRAAARAHVRSLADSELQAELQRRFRESGLA